MMMVLVGLVIARLRGISGRRIALLSMVPVVRVIHAPFGCRQDCLNPNPGLQRQIVVR